MSRGGAREGAGRKPKFEYLGQTTEGKTVRIPKQITLDRLEQFIKEELIKIQNLDNKN